MVETERAGESIERAEARHAAIRPHTRTVIRDKTGAVALSNGSSTEAAMPGPAAAQTVLGRVAGGMRLSTRARVLANRAADVCSMAVCTENLVRICLAEGIA